MVDDELDGRIARLARFGRARDFSAARFRRDLEAAVHEGVTREEILCLLIADWTGVTVSEGDVGPLWDEVGRVHETLSRALPGPVSLQTALLHEFHSKRALLQEPRILSDRDVVTLRGDAITDPLTGLYNRRFLRDHLEREVSRAERSGSVVSVLLMDLRGFKAINDRLGHPVGDGVLVRTARRIRDSLRLVDAGCVQQRRIRERDRREDNLGDALAHDNAPNAARPWEMIPANRSTCAGSASTSGGRTPPMASPDSRAPAFTSATAYPGTSSRSATNGR